MGDERVGGNLGGDGQVHYLDFVDGIAQNWSNCALRVCAIYCMSIELLTNNPKLGSIIAAIWSSYYIYNRYEAHLHWYEKH